MAFTREEALRLWDCLMIWIDSPTDIPSYRVFLDECFSVLEKTEEDFWEEHVAFHKQMYTYFEVYRPAHPDGSMEEFKVWYETYTGEEG